MLLQFYKTVIQAADMKKLLLCVLLLPFITAAQNGNAEGFIITGKINGLPENEVVYLAGNDENDTIAKTTVQNGSFTLTGKVDNTDGRLLIFNGIDKKLFLFHGNETLNVSASDASLTDVYISGSPTQQDYEEFIFHIKPLSDYVNMYRMQMQTAPNFPARDSFMIMLNTSYNIYQNTIDEFITRKKNSPVASLVLAFSYDMDPNHDVMLLEKRFNNLGDAAKQNRYAAGVKNVISIGKIGAVGTQAIEFSQTDTTGKKVSLSQFRGKYVLVDFWASWCGPCRKENPNVVAAYNSFKSKNFTILSVSLDQDKTKWLNAIHADNLKWTHVSDLKYWNNEVAQLYHIGSIPANMLVDPNGVIIAKNLRGEDLQQKLKTILK